MDTRYFLQNHNSNDYRRMFRELQRRSARESKELNLTSDTANEDVNNNKNRWNVLPYDQNRVILPGGRYINASPFCHRNLNERPYILTQGPLSAGEEHQDTQTDFWEMVSTNNTPIIVMLCNTVEDESVKCAEYFPTMEQQTKTFGNFTLTLNRETKVPTYIVRSIEMQHVETLEKRTITHLQYLNWPDYGVPENCAELVHFISVARQYWSNSVEQRQSVSRRLEGAETSVPPIVCHCSAGIGRTGTFVVIDTVFDMLSKDDPQPTAAEGDNNAQINTLEDLIVFMRRYRAGLVYNAEQLQLCWAAIMHGIRQR